MQIRLRVKHRGIIHLMETTVLNLMTGEHITYCSISPLMAVVCAYEQSRNNWNTWDYNFINHPALEQTDLCLFCGDFGAVKYPERFKKNAQLRLTLA